MFQTYKDNNPKRGRKTERENKEKEKAEKVKRHKEGEK